LGWEIKIKINFNSSGQKCPFHKGCSGAGEQQVPPLRRRWRSDSGRNDKSLVGRRVQNQHQLKSYFSFDGLRCGRLRFPLLAKYARNGASIFVALA